MIAGKLNEIITVESPMIVENELGEVMDNRYKTKYRTRAQVVYKNGSTSVDNHEIFTSYNIQFIIRIYNEVSETDRVIYRGKPYLIDSIEYSREYQLIRLNCILQNE